MMFRGAVEFIQGRLRLVRSKKEIPRSVHVELNPQVLPELAQCYKALVKPSAGG